MGRYILRRVLIALPTLLAITFVVYVILALAPIDPLSSFGADPRVPPEAREAIRKSLGLDDPWPLRYVKWVGGLLRGDFGRQRRTNTGTSTARRKSVAGGQHQIEDDQAGEPPGLTSEIRSASTELA